MGFYPFTKPSPYWYNIVNYGADPTGNTDSSAAIQSAVNTAIAAGGGTVYAPAGLYTMANVALGNNILFRGDGMGVTVFQINTAAASGSVVMRVAPASASVTTSWCFIQDLTIDGQKSFWGNNSNQKIYGFYMGQGTAGLISDCGFANVEIRNCLTYGFDVEQVASVTLTNCWCHDNGYTTGSGTEHNADGFTFIGDDITAIGCRSWNNAERGFLCGQSSATWHRVNLIGCTAWDNGVGGATMGSSSDNLFGSNIIGGAYYSNTGYGIQFSAGASGCTISGADIYNNTAEGILLAACDHCAVTGNTLLSNATAASSDPEIYLNGATNCTVTGNMVDSTTATHAISEANSANANAITGNNVTSTSATIQVTGANSQAVNNVGSSVVATIPGLISVNGGTDTSGTATASAPTFVTATAQQLNTTQDTMLYIAVTTSTAVEVQIGPTSTPATTICNITPALSVISVRIPKGWYVKITATIADLAITAVTC